MIRQALLDIIRGIKDPGTMALTDDCHFIQSLGLKSLDVVVLIERIQERFGVTLGEHPSDLDVLLSFGTLARWIEGKQNAAA